MNHGKCFGHTKARQDAHYERLAHHLRRQGITEIILDGHHFTRAFGIEGRTYRIKPFQGITFLNANYLPSDDRCFGGVPIQIVHHDDDPLGETRYRELSSLWARYEAMTHD